MSRMRWMLCALAVAAGVAAAPASRIARVENGLRPPVLVEGDKTWELSERMRLFHIRGVSVAAIRDFKIEWAKGYGFADAEAKQPVTDATLFQAGSISKGVAAMGALVLVQDGKLALDGDINTQLKTWKVPENEHTKKASVTLEGLLSHTAGLTVHGFPGYADGTPVPTIVQVLDGTPPANTAAIRVDLDPGTEWRYSGGGYTIAQLAMIDVAGEPFPGLLARTVLGPLGMTRSTYEQPLPPKRVAEAAVGYRADGSPIPGKRNVYPEMAAAGLWTTPSDLARFAIGIQKMLRGDKGPLSPAMAKNMVTPRKEGYGLGLAVEEKGGGTYFTHGGSDEGFQALLYAHATKGYGAILMTNSDAGFRIMPEILRSIGAAYGWDGFQKEPVRPAKLSAEELARFAGRYKLDTDSVLVVARKGRGLEAKPTLESAFELVPVAADVFVRRDEEIRYRFGAADLRIEERAKSRTAAKASTDDARVPAEDLEAGRIGEALAAYRKLRDTNPSEPAVGEPRFNGIGYGLMERKQFPAAIAIFELNTELYPVSANTYDSLAEAYMKSGDKARAIALYRTALEKIPGDPKLTAGQKESQRANALAKLKELEP
jgi:CubicO group peptidase (beta-lactamase class C family)